ncbi:hypothetical protein ABBQ38_007640 [Trebouxia sp. C0009 RCD-2024]
MSRPGLFRSLRDFFREMRSFGNPELENLKLQARALQKQLDQLEAMRAAREQQEEALALMHMQNTVQNLQQLDKILQKSETVIAAAVAEASARTDQRVKTMLQQKAQEVVSKLDLHKALSLDIPPEQIVKDAVQQTAAQLESEGGLANLGLPGPQSQAAPPVQDQPPPAATGQAGTESSPPIQHQQKRQVHQQMHPAWRALPPR